MQTGDPQMCFVLKALDHHTFSRTHSQATSINLLVSSNLSGHWSHLNVWPPPPNKKEHRPQRRKTISLNVGGSNFFFLNALWLTKQLVVHYGQGFFFPSSKYIYLAIHLSVSSDCDLEIRSFFYWNSRIFFSPKVLLFL